MEIIKAEKGDLPRLREIYAYARNYMREKGRLPEGRIAA